MNAAEYRVMARVEDQHWWYRAQRTAIRSVIERFASLKTLQRCVALDAGCGTGGHMKWLRSLLNPSQLAGFDISPDAVQLAQTKNPDAQIWCDDLAQLRSPFPLSAVDLLLCSDVIYAMEPSTVLRSLQALTARLRSGGLFVLHVPALPWLFSQHDLAVGTRHRYRLHEIRTLMQQLGLDLLFASYRMCLLLPFMLLRRLPSILSCALRTNHTTQNSCSAERKPESNAESELRMPASWVNRLLCGSLGLESFWFSRGLVFPLGSSILALGRKP